MNKALEKYECDGQMSLFDLVEETPAEPQEEIPKETPKAPQTFADYIGRCEYCYWGTDEKTCYWSSKNETRDRCLDPNCREKHEWWRPNCYKIPRLCGNCKFSNQFHYDMKDEYKKEAAAHNGYSYNGSMHPVENNTLYCLRRDDHEDAGAVNRTHPFADREDRGFGIGYWHRQYEWATCDAWELDSSYYKELKNV